MPQLDVWIDNDWELEKGNRREERPTTHLPETRLDSGRDGREMLPDGSQSIRKQKQGHGKPMPILDSPRRGGGGGGSGRTTHSRISIRLAKAPSLSVHMTSHSIFGAVVEDIFLIDERGIEGTVCARRGPRVSLGYVTARGNMVKFGAGGGGGGGSLEGDYCGERSFRFRFDGSPEMGVAFVMELVVVILPICTSSTFAS